MLLVSSPVAAGAPSTLTFNARGDFQAAPNQANPSGPWSYRQQLGNGSKPLLGEFWTDADFTEGLEMWHGDQISTSEKDKLPWVGVNTTGVEQHPVGIDWPAGALLVHPGYVEPVIVRWTSPEAGRIRVNAAVVDRDASCGDGVHWVIQLDNRNAIAKGVINNGGHVKVRTGSIAVVAGSRLELRIGVRQTNSCDSTQIRFVIELTPSS